jgi:DNA-3-methyladenine glycosylase I
VPSATGSPAKHRCAWPKGNPLLTRYHDREWGVPLRRDRRIFEFLVLESAQAGLSWLTVLQRRAGYRKAFAGFDAKRVAEYRARDVERLLRDPGIIRNRAKVEAAVTNAARFLEVQDEFGSFADYMWGFVGGEPRDGRRRADADIPATSPVAEAFAKDLRARGFKFLGPTVVSAHMQAVGMVNDHTLDCFRHDEVKAASWPGRARGGAAGAPVRVRAPA